MDQESISERIRVYCRLRPDLPEDSGGESDFYLTGDDNSGTGTCITSSTKDGDCVYYSSTAKREHKFKLDGFFGPSTTQDQLYDIAVRPIVDSALKGYSGTVFAYGPTGSGKTFTMVGEQSAKGVIPRVFDQLLTAASSSRGLVNISVSYLQIYCELVSDLLDPRPATLSIREKPGGNIYVENLSEIVVTTYSDVVELLERGECNRTTAATNTNSSSSRSHAAILIKITTPDEQAPMRASGAADSGGSSGGGVAVKESTLVLVDLAGSERATAVAGRNYLRAEESKSINLSLSALGNCISALASSQGGSSSADWRAGGGSGTGDRDRVRHIPYRDSKLTRLLQGSLGGGSRTAVIVNLPPGTDTTGEVLNALRFASRCATVSVVAKVHRVVDYESLFIKLQQKLDAQEQREREQQFDIDKQYELVDQQEQQIDALKEEIAILRRQLETLRPPTGSDGTSGGALKPSMTSNSAGDDSEWAARIADMSEQHLQEMNDMRGKYEKRVAAYKRAAAEASQDMSVLQQDLKVERERHLEALKDLNVMKERHNEAERSFDLRVQELLEDIEASAQSADLNQRVVELEEQLREKSEEIDLLEKKVGLLQGGAMDGMVSRAQVEEMEAVFADTIDRLSARVMQLEESKGAMGGVGGRMASSGSVGGLPAVPPRGNARMEPGRIRPNGGYDGGTVSNKARGRF